MKELMYMSKFQEWCGRHYGYIPENLHKTKYEAFRDAAMARAVERATPIGVTPEEQVAVVVMHILKSQIPASISNRDQGLDPVETELCELVTIKGHDYIVIGAQSPYVRINGGGWIKEVACRSIKGRSQVIWNSFAGTCSLIESVASWMEFLGAATTR
jgi:hypothetical protein